MKVFVGLLALFVSVPSAAVAQVPENVNETLRHIFASAEFAPRVVTRAIEKLIDDPASRRAVAVEATYPKELEAPYEGVEVLLRTLASSYKIGVIFG